MTAVDAPDATTTAALHAAVLELRGELARTDAKAGTLVALVTLLLTVGGGALVAVPVPHLAAKVGWCGVAVLVAVKVTLLLAMRPRLPKTDGSWQVRINATPADLADLLTNPATVVGYQTAQVHLLGGLAVAKYRQLRLATDLLLVAVALAVAAAVLALLVG